MEAYQDTMSPDQQKQQTKRFHLAGFTFPQYPRDGILHMLQLLNFGQPDDDLDHQMANTVIRLLRLRIAYDALWPNDLDDQTVLNILYDAIAHEMSPRDPKTRGKFSTTLVTELFNILLSERDETPWNKIKDPIFQQIARLTDVLKSLVIHDGGSRQHSQEIFSVWGSAPGDTQFASLVSIMLQTRAYLRRPDSTKLNTEVIPVFKPDVSWKYDANGK